jgi:hypothetical protein
MSGVEDSGPHRLVAELATTPGAVPVLLALQDRGGHATREALDRSCGDENGADDALRWLTTVGLVRPTGPASIGGGPAEVFELTEVGTVLTRSLTDLARALAEPPLGEL